MPESILNNKRLLAVDDERDILETLEEQLEDYEGLILDKALDYETGYQLLRSWSYDLVILDIMGVRGFDLLNAAVHLGFPSVMLTAHAFTLETLKKSIELGARAYLPKEKMTELVPFLEDVLSLGYGTVWRRVFERVGHIFGGSFGPEWQKDKKVFKEQVASGKYKPEPAILK